LCIFLPILKSCNWIFLPIVAFKIFYDHKSIKLDSFSNVTFVLVTFLIYLFRFSIEFVV
jgi:hypothetical protein